MDGRRILWHRAITCCALLLSLLVASHRGGVHSPREDASMVSISFGPDANLSLGLQEDHRANSYFDSNSYVEEIKTTPTREEMLMKYTQMLIKIIMKEEGFSAVPYLCSSGYVTIGFGTKLHDKKGMNPKDFPIRVSREMAEMWLLSEIEIKVNRLERSRYFAVFNRLNDNRKIIIISMAYQMGVSGVLGFRSMWHSLSQEDYPKAGAHALDSKWAKKDSEARAIRHARVLRTGNLDDSY